MNFEVGQLVIYPNHGIGLIERIGQQQFGTDAFSMYELRLSFNNSMIHVPVQNADEIGLRLPVSAGDCDLLFANLSDDFSAIPGDWKIRHRDYSEKVRQGALFEVADVLKKLTFLSRQKPLSFREQRLLEKSRYLVVSELAAVCNKDECQTEERVDRAIDEACAKHQLIAFPANMAVSATVH
ncbi:MAG: CarD family transcriptional regulator [Pyrinomonadaceae bacterium]